MKTALFYLALAAIIAPAVYVGWQQVAHMARWQAAERAAREAAVPVSRSCGGGFAYGWCRP